MSPSTALAFLAYWAGMIIIPLAIAVALAA